MHNYLSLSRVGAVALILIVVVIALAGCVHRVVSVEELEKMINDQVPIGSDKQQVKAFIDNLKIDSLRIWRGDFGKADKNLRPVGFWDEEKLAALWDSVEELISARIFDAESGFLNHNDIFIEFAIDNNGRMIGYTIKMVGTK